jgi:Uma2 family endonuclease
MSQYRSLTSEELALHPIPNKRTELVRGRLVVREPAKWRHGTVAARILVAIGIYLDSNPIGTVAIAETGFTLARRPDTVRAPDVAFVRTERVPTEEVVGFEEVAPDLVVEVLSPGDRTRMVHAKVADWLRAGTQLVWVVDPRRQVVDVYRADGSTERLDVEGSLDGEDVLPGFRLAVARAVSR